jgi:hypothetical protein
MMSDPPDGDGHLRTAWHPLLVMLLELLLPPEHWQVVAEYPLTREPRRIDAVIVRRLDDDAGWQPQYLRSVLADLSAHNLVHFKGATDALDRSDALQVLSYALQYAIAERLEALDVLTLRVVAPTLTPRFQAQWLALGGTLSPSTTPGCARGAGCWASRRAWSRPRWCGPTPTSTCFTRCRPRASPIRAKCAPSMTASARCTTICFRASPDSRKTHAGGPS